MPLVVSKCKVGCKLTSFVFDVRGKFGLVVFVWGNEPCRAGSGMHGFKLIRF